MKEQPNIILVVADTLRTAYMGCYGNEEIRTPNIDAFAKQSTLFTRAYPESLPTIPVRRALHTGRRAYPFRDYKPVKWDIVYLPGWQPISEDEDTLAENLADGGYHTGFYADTLPYFAPAMNFTRGFWQWEFIRGQQQDRWKSPATADPNRIASYGLESFGEGLQKAMKQHAANTGWMRYERDYCTARVFQAGMDFIEDNRHNTPFYLMVDSFAPHEPWEAPGHYYEMYADPDYAGRLLPHVRYDALETFGTEEELRNIVAHYCGLVTFVDTWFGRLLEKLEHTGQADNTYVILTSDHGTNFADNPDSVVGKPSRALYPGTMHLPLIIRHPEGKGAGKVIDDLVSNVDIIATIYDATGKKSEDGIDGVSLLGCMTNGKGTGREYLTSRYGNHVWYRDDDYWVFCNIYGENPRVFDMHKDPGCLNDIADSTPEAFKRAWERILADAGGELPDYSERKRTEADGQEAIKKE